jgi:hypothetical protein
MRNTPLLAPRIINVADVALVNELAGIAWAASSSGQARDRPRQENNHRFMPRGRGSNTSARGRHNGGCRRAAKIKPPAPPFKCVCGAETNKLTQSSCACTCPTVKEQARRGGRPPHLAEGSETLAASNLSPSY